MELWTLESSESVNVTKLFVGRCYLTQQRLSSQNWQHIKSNKGPLEHMESHVDVPTVTVIIKKSARSMVRQKLRQNITQISILALMADTWSKYNVGNASAYFTSSLVLWHVRVRETVHLTHLTHWITHCAERLRQWVNIWLPCPCTYERRACPGKSLPFACKFVFNGFDPTNHAAWLSKGLAAHIMSFWGWTDLKQMD